MEQNHTPEPWDVYTDIVRGSEGQWIAEVNLFRPIHWEGTQINEPEQSANAARIVACVNALATIANPERFMQAARDLMVAAAAAADIWGMNWNLTSPEGYAATRIRTAIAAMKEAGECT